ncbi:MAG: hypothetical protein KIS82_06355 [Ferruginibacter sp.]|nr:hypothetical protein [Bacteroidota bacterium]MCW5916955.1 hypothetical protein [Ferruginibacter sp.]
MNTGKSNQEGRSVAEQTEHNITGWVGQRPGGPKHISRGQTFKILREAEINRVEVFTELVMHPGTVTLTLHKYDPESGSWGPELTKVSTSLTSANDGMWLGFEVPKLHVVKDGTYGLRIESQDSYFGVGEAAGSANRPPIAVGQEWIFSENNPLKAFKYFSLSFKVKAVA